METINRRRLLWSVLGLTLGLVIGFLVLREPSETLTTDRLDEARRRFRAGNLYLNRGITGALVARQPFGGFGLSGTGTKAGGPEYLLHFVVPRACTENTMRHGFAPELL